MLDLIEHLVDWTRDAPLLLLCLARPELIDARPAWNGSSITLAPLSREESDELIGELLGDSRLRTKAALECGRWLREILSTSNRCWQ